MTTLAEEIKKFTEWHIRQKSKGLVGLHLALAIDEERFSSWLNGNPPPESPKFESVLRELNLINEAVDSGKTKAISSKL